MGKCHACKREMTTAKGCTLKYILAPDGKFHKREKVGDEGWVQPGERCGDCGALYGNYHHPNCDIERCPVCGFQLLSCLEHIASYALSDTD